MRRGGWILTILGLVVVFGFLLWALYAVNSVGGSWTGGSFMIGAMIALGALGAGVLGAILMWLAFYSARKGYDERAHYDHLDEPE